MKHKNYGWVYFISSGHGRYHKIGISSNGIKNRIANYRTHNPHQIKLLQIIYVLNNRDLEKKLHNKYFPDTGTDWSGKLSKQDIENIVNEMTQYAKENSIIPDYVKELI